MMNDNLFGSSAVIAKAPDSTRMPRLSVYIDDTIVDGVFSFISNSMTAASDLQIDRSFSDDLLVTAFGQKVTALQIAGISLSDSLLSDTALCDNAAELGNGGFSQRTLPELYLEYHAGKRKKGTEKVPLTRVVYSGTVFEGFLVGLTQSPYTVSDGKNLDVLQYTFTIMGNLKLGG